MRQILFRLIGILEVAGGFYGLARVLPRLLEIGPLRTAAIGLIELALYVFVLIAGVLLIENSERGVRLSSIAQLLQLPLIATPIFSYALHCGGFVNLYATLHIPTHADIGWHFGSEGFILQFAGPAASHLGINLLGLLSWLILKLR
jgi:hypothetical protein